MKELTQQLIDIYGSDNIDNIISKKINDKQFKQLSKKPEKIDIDEDECKKLCEKVGLEYLQGYEKRVVEHTITDETVDRYGDIVRVSGLNIKEYMKNSVVLFAHDYTQPPVGKCIKIWLDNNSNSMKAWSIIYDDRVDISGRSSLIYNFISSGAMPACSIGFKPTETNRPKTAKERETLGLGEYGIEYLKSELLEYSICSVGANPNALKNSLFDMVRNKFITIKDFEKAKQTKIVPDYVFDDFIEFVKNSYGEIGNILVDTKYVDAKEHNKDINLEIKQTLETAVNEIKKLCDTVKELNIALKPDVKNDYQSGSETNGKSVLSILDEPFKI